jgi:hypothetical protein
MRSDLENKTNLASSSASRATTHRLQSDLPLIDSVDKFMSGVKDKASVDQGIFFRVTKDVFDYFTDRQPLMRDSPDNIARVNRLLGTDFPQDEPMGLFRPLSCPNCKRELSFADIVEAAVQRTVHARDELNSLLSGEDYYLITMPGKEKDRMHCIACNAFVPLYAYKAKKVGIYDPEFVA